MRRLIAVAIVVAGVALPVCAQRGGGHGGGGHSGGGFAGRSGSFASHSSGFAGHIAPAFRSSYAPMSRPGFMGSPQVGSSRVLSPAPGTTLARRGAAPIYYRRPPVSPGAYRYRLPYVSYYGAGYGYGAAGWSDPDCYDFPDSAGCGYYDDSTYANQAVGPPASVDYPGGYAPPPGEQADVAPPEAYRPAYAQPQPPPEPESAVTLVFKDGRPSEQIHNYMLTRTTLYVQDEHRRVISVADLDLAATQKVNKDAGVDFQLPGSGR
jgi:hypothetical protein